jgi:hypothetical protein
MPFFARMLWKYEIYFCSIYFVIVLYLVIKIRFVKQVSEVQSKLREIKGDIKGKSFTVREAKLRKMLL